MASLQEKERKDGAEDQGANGEDRPKRRLQPMGGHRQGDRDRGQVYRAWMLSITRRAVAPC